MFDVGFIFNMLLKWSTGNEIGKNVTNYFSFSPFTFSMFWFLLNLQPKNIARTIKHGFWSFITLNDVVTEFHLKRDLRLSLHMQGHYQQTHVMIDYQTTLFLAFFFLVLSKKLRSFLNHIQYIVDVKQVNWYQRVSKFRIYNNFFHIHE